MADKKKRLFDLGLILFCLLLAGALYLGLGAKRESGGWAVVRVEGEITARYPLDTDGTFPLNGGSNILVIENGEAWLSEANCPDKLCVRQGLVRWSGQCITCLPNRLTVTIEGGDNGGVDIFVG